MRLIVSIVGGFGSPNGRVHSELKRKGKTHQAARNTPIRVKQIFLINRRKKAGESPERRNNMIEMIPRLNIKPGIAITWLNTASVTSKGRAIANLIEVDENKAFIKTMTAKAKKPI